MVELEKNFRHFSGLEKRRVLVVLCFFLVVLFLGSFFHSRSAESGYFELAQIASESPSWDFREASKFFKDLSEVKGALYAYEVLLRAPLPAGTDLHLLAHVVGDELYKQRGIGGITSCTDDFRNACSHSIVIGALFSNGEGILNEIADICKQAPGGSGAYTMCFHGLGHGVLAFKGYELPEAVKLCEMVGTSEYQYREYTECVGGSIMEMIAGVHDTRQWEKKSAIFFKKSDPLYPCSASFIPTEVRPICYSYLTPHLFEAVGGSLAAPTPDNFEKAFSLCEALPVSQRENRKACFGGFGKEFVVLANVRDIRSLDSMDDTALQKIISWCALAKSQEAILSCNGNALASLYWGGENSGQKAVRFCSLMNDDDFRSVCFNDLMDQFLVYTPVGSEREKLCVFLPGNYQNKCRTAVGQ